MAHTDAYRAKRRRHRKAYYARYPEKALERGQRYRASHPEQTVQKYQRLREYGRAHPEQQRLIWQVREKVRTALRNGVLVKPTICEKCGSDDRKITAAHHDYTKPLDIRWLCWPCHCRWDRQEPKLYRRPDEKNHPVPA